MIAGEEDAKLSKILATINVNSPVEPDLEQCDIEQMYNEESRQMIRRLGFKSLLHRFSETTEEKEQEFCTTEISSKNYFGRETFRTGEKDNGWERADRICHISGK